MKEELKLVRKLLHQFKVEAPTTRVELQLLIGKINFNRRLISNMSGKIQPFSSLLKLKADQEFVWGKEQQEALKGIKHYLTFACVSSTTKAQAI